MLNFWRFYYVIIRNMHILPGIIRKMRKMIADSEKYSEEDRYEYLLHIIEIMKRTAWIKTEVYGTENLPKDTGYMMYPNHQGKYDAYGIIEGHGSPCSIVMDKEKSYYPFITELVQMVQGKRLDRHDVRQGLTIINELIEEVKLGRRFILFPEGGYTEGKGNTMEEFKAGCFKIPLKTNTPIVPVTIIDSYKVFNTKVTGTVTTQVHFLKPIMPEEYHGMKTKELAELVKARIQEKLNEVLEMTEV